MLFFSHFNETTEQNRKLRFKTTPEHYKREGKLQKLFFLFFPLNNFQKQRIEVFPENCFEQFDAFSF